MQIHFGQIYIEPGANFPFSHMFQHFISKEVTTRVIVSSKFEKKYGTDFHVIFRISAKRMILDNEIRGPTVFKKAHNVEFTIFLPFNVIAKTRDPLTVALQYLFQGVYSVLELHEIDTKSLKAAQDSLIDQIRGDRTMFEATALA